MKKILLLTAASLGLGFAANAQEVNFAVVDIQVPAAYTLVNCTSTDTIKPVLRIVNLGPTVVQATDTVIVVTPSHASGFGAIINLSGTWAVNDTITFNANGFTAAQIANWGEIDASGTATRKYTATNPIPNDTIGFNFSPTIGSVSKFTLGSNNRGLYIPVIYNCTTSTDDIAKATTLNVYPNPANTTINFSYDFVAAQNATVRVYDLMGRTVLTQDFGKQAAGVNNFTIDIATLSNGIYYVEMASGEARGISKFTVSK